MTTGVWIGVLFMMLCSVCSAQVPTMSASELQQCANDLACSINYSGIFQTKLDNMSHYIELELALLRHQTNNILIPIQTDLAQLKVNRCQEMSVVYLAIARTEKELASDRDQLANLTRNTYEINDNFHTENTNRFQDVHQLQLDLAATKNDITALTSMVTALMLQSANGSSVPYTLPVGTGSGGAGTSCADKDIGVTVLRNNLTYHINALASSQQALETVRALEAYLQTQVVELKANLTQAENVNRIKDHLIINLQNQLKQAQSSSPNLPSADTCGDGLGMQSGSIPASSVTASASQSGYEPTHARLDDSQGWYTPERTDSTDFLQIDTGKLHFITKVATQGAPCCDVMVTNYTLQYSTDGNTWQDYKKDCQTQYLAGNSDASTIIEQRLDTAILA